MESRTPDPLRTADDTSSGANAGTTPTQASQLFVRRLSEAMGVGDLAAIGFIFRLCAKRSQSGRQTRRPMAAAATLDPASAEFLRDLSAIFASEWPAALDFVVRVVMKRSQSDPQPDRPRDGTSGEGADTEHLLAAVRPPAGLPRQLSALFAADGPGALDRIVQIYADEFGPDPRLDRLPVATAARDEGRGDTDSARPQAALSGGQAHFVRALAALSDLDESGALSLIIRSYREQFELEPPPAGLWPSLGSMPN